MCEKCIMLSVLSTNFLFDNNTSLFARWDNRFGGYIWHEKLSNKMNHAPNRIEKIQSTSPDKVFT